MLYAQSCLRNAPSESFLEYSTRREQAVPQIRKTTLVYSEISLKLTKPRKQTKKKSILYKIMIIHILFFFIMKTDIL